MKLSTESADVVDRAQRDCELRHDTEAKRLRREFDVICSAYCAAAVIEIGDATTEALRKVDEAIYGAWKGEQELMKIHWMT